MRVVGACLAFALLVLPVAASPDDISWSTLIDQDAQTFDDPFKELTASELGRVATAAQLRQRLRQPDLTEAERERLQSRLNLKDEELADANIDIDRLLSQRWEVAEKRRKAAWSVNRAAEGKTIRIMGYFLLGRSIKPDALSAYLVPEFGMCSHVPPPPPNNLIHLELPEDSELPERLYAPVEIIGELEAERQEITTHVVDGVVNMASAWRLHVESLRLLGNDLKGVNPRSRGNWPVTLNRAETVSVPSQ